MIDTLLKQRPNFKKPEIWKSLNLSPKSYVVMTLNRPANVDEEYKLKALIDEIIIYSGKLPLVFPMHPRTAAIFERLNIKHPRLHTIAPLSYLDFKYLVERAKVVITDSGGITEETTVMNVPCMTVRDNTERPETITQGTNELLGTDPKSIAPAFSLLFSGNWKKTSIPELWDGKTSQRIVSKLISL